MRLQLDVIIQQKHKQLIHRRWMFRELDADITSLNQQTQESLLVNIRRQQHGIILWRAHERHPGNGEIVANSLPSKVGASERGTVLLDNHGPVDHHWS